MAFLVYYQLWNIKEHFSARLNRRNSCRKSKFAERGESHKV